MHRVKVGHIFKSKPFQHSDDSSLCPSSQPPSPPLSLLSRLESVGFFWLPDWPTDADLLNLRKHSETPERSLFLWHIFPLQAHFCADGGCTAEQSGGRSSDRNLFSSDPSAAGRRAQLDCVHTRQTAD